MDKQDSNLAQLQSILYFSTRIKESKRQKQKKRKEEEEKEEGEEGREEEKGKFYLMTLLMKSN